MPKSKTNFVCQQCNYSQIGWSGKCPNCGTWGSLVETLLQSKDGPTSRKSSLGARTQKLNEIKIGTKSRISTKISELDRVLGGGIVSGQVILLAGEPGIGKSTLLLQVAQSMGEVVYVSGEESGIQVKIRADRLGIKSKGIAFIETTDVDSVIDILGGMSPKLVIIDSIQTMATSDLSGMSGSVGQVRECAYRLLRWAKANNVAIVLVGHVTKQGSVAGPAVLAHIVDSVLWFEGDQTHTLRILRAIKNRFGPTDEAGIFMMEQQGLVSITDASSLFLTNTEGRDSQAGSVITSIMEGSRPMLIEIQSLVVSSKTPYPKRVVQGVDVKRVEMLLGVLARRSGVPVLDYDVYVNVAGGIDVREPAADLAIALSIASAYKDKALASGSIVVGEVGLLGEIREVPRQDRRLDEAKRQGYKKQVTNKQFASLKAAMALFR
jgi:DNA repair protein RadA/Sms